MKKINFLLLFSSLCLLLGCQNQNQKVKPGTLDDVVFPDDGGETITPPQPVTLPLEGSEAPGSLDLSNVSLSYYDNQSFYQLGGQWNGYGVHYPSIYKFNGIYYLYMSTPSSNIGVRAYKSTDLVNWSLVTESGFPLGYICKDRQTYGLKGPKVIFHDDKFYLYGNSLEGYRLFVSSSPEGPFTYLKNLNISSSYNASMFKAPNGKLFFVTGGEKEAYLYEMNDIDDVDLNSRQAIKNTRVNESKGSTASTESPSLFIINDTLYLLYSSSLETYTSYRCNVIANTAPDYTSSLSLSRGFYNNNQGPILVGTNSMNESGGFGDISLVEGPDMVSYYALYTTRENDNVRHFNISPISYSSANIYLSHRLTRSIVPEMNINYLLDEPYEERVLTDTEIGNAMTAYYHFQDLEEIYFGYQSSNNTFVISFDEEKATFAQRVNGLNQVISSISLQGHEHEVRIQNGSSLHVYLDDVDLALNYQLKEFLKGKIGYKKNNKSKIDRVLYSLSNSDFAQQNAFKNAEMMIPGLSLFKEGSSLSTNYEKTITNDINFRNERALVLEKYHDYVRYLVDVRQNGHYGLEITCNASFSKYQCSLGLRVGTETEVMYKMDRISDSGYIRTLTAEFDVNQSCNEILVENLSNLPLEIITISLKKVAKTIPQYENSLDSFEHDGVYYHTDFLFDKSYNCHRTFEGAYCFAYIGEETITDCVYEMEIAFDTAMNTGYAIMGIRCDNFAFSRIDSEDSGQGYFLIVEKFKTTLVKHNYGYNQTLGSISLANTVGEFANYKVLIRGNYIEVYREDFKAISVIDSLAVSNGHLAFGAYDTTVLLRNIKVHGEES